MNEEGITDEKAQRAATMHRVYSYLLQLRARKEAADRDTDANRESQTAGDTPAIEPGVEGV